jgi:hypothetical protein
LEQHPPNIKESIAPIVSHCGIVSMNIRPSSAIILEEVGLSLSMPNISAFSNEGAALITFGIAASPSADECNSRNVVRLRDVD